MSALSFLLEGGGEETGGEKSTRYLKVTLPSVLTPWYNPLPLRVDGICDLILTLDYGKGDGVPHITMVMGCVCVWGGVLLTCNA